jgi:ribonuclease R
VSKRERADARVVWPPSERQPARAAIEELMRDRGLARAFAEKVEGEARRARDAGRARAEREVANGRRRDLRELATFTIDPASARDFDDAISAERLPPRDGGGAGGVRVWVHIADVSAYVREGTLVDEEARERGTSVYVPGAVEPMLPEALSNDACSLVPGAERAAVTVELDLVGARVRRTAFYRSLIHSDVSLDYERVDRMFAGDERAEEPWAAPLAAAREVAAALGAAREREGGLVLDTEEPEIVFDEGGHVLAIEARVQTESHRLIEHLMIAANEAVARRLAERGAACLYRVHERPEPERVKRLIDQLASLSVPTPPVPEPLSKSQAAELMSEAARRVERHLWAVVAKARADGDGAAAGPWGGRLALTSLVLRTLQQAYYSPKNIGHAGLSSTCYCHFTSPIRRYPDLVCHRALIATLDGGRRGPRARDLPDLGEWCSVREREAVKIERDADDMARCYALERVLYEDGWEQVFVGEVTGLISAGAFVAFGGSGAEGASWPKGPLYEGMLPVRRMNGVAGEREWWELGEEGTTMRGERTGATLRLGDAIAVQVARVDTARGRVDLVPAATDGDRD